jgi:hypothetical protein
VGEGVSYSGLIGGPDEGDGYYSEAADGLSQFDGGGGEAGDGRTHTAVLEG